MSQNEHVRDDLKAYLDGQLGPGQRLAVRLHLARCAACRKEMITMENIGKELRAGEGEGMDAVLRARILSAIPDSSEGMADAPTATGSKPRAAQRKRQKLIWVTVGAACLAWFVLYPALTTLSKRSVSPRGDSAVSQEAAAVPQVPGTSKSQQQIAMASRMYAQDYASFKDGMKSSRTYANAGPGAASAPTEKSQGLATSAPADTLGARAYTGRNLPAATATPAAAPLMQFVGPRVAPTSVPAKGKMPARARGRTMELESALAADEIPTERQVHKEAEITVQVDKVEPKSESVEQIVKSVGGFVANNQLSTEEDETKTASLTVKIPVAQFESILAQIARLGEVKAKNITGEDVTERTSDEEQTGHVLREDITSVEAKLRHARTKTQTRQDEEDLRKLRIRHAQSQARLVILKRMAAMSTITITLQEKPKKTTTVAPSKQSGGFLSEIGDTAHTAMESFLQAARLPVLVLIWLLVYSPVVVIFAMAYRYAVRT